MIKKFLTGLIMLWIIVFGGFFLTANYYNKVISKPFVLEQDSYQVKIKKGSNFNTVLNSLDKEGKLRNYYISKFYISRNNIKPKIIPGFLTINKNMSFDDFITGLENVKAEDPDAIKITIPEGYDIGKISELMEKKGVISKDEFLKACKEYELPDYVSKNNKRKFALEGFLFPDTYEFKKGSTGTQIIDTMLNRFEMVINDIAEKTGEDIGSDKIDKLIILASIVEKEIVKSDERELAASVFQNRLEKGMKLESCATVLYALGVHKDKILDEDLKVDSPYNTYKVKSLPIGPICSPGRASIEAALEPADTKYLYFVSKNDGSHVFSDNFKDHVEAKNKYLGEN